MRPRLLGIFFFTLIVLVIAGGLVALDPGDWPMFLFAVSVVTLLGAAPVVFSVLSRRQALHGSIKPTPRDDDDATIVIIKNDPGA